MTKFNLSPNITTECVLKINDNTNFKTTTNESGFTNEDSLDIILNEYRISDGYLVNVLIYNKYNTTAVIVNNESFLHVDKIDVKPDYNVNYPHNIYKLTKDGSYTFKKYFIISKEFYLANKINGIFVNKDIIYIDDNKIYKVIDDIPQLYLLTDLINDNLTNFTGFTKSFDFISTCFLQKCYFNLEKSLLTDLLNCNPSNRKDRDVVFMAMNVIQYLEELNNSSEIQKIIETLNDCGGICSKLLKVTGHDCGCS